MAAQSEVLLNGRPVQGSIATNAVATATAAAILGVRHFVTGIDADYSPAVAAIKTVTLKFGTTVMFVWRWDFSKGPFIRNLPLPVHGDYNQAVSVELEAGGVAVDGRCGFSVSDS
jgi:hypothetical protein